MRHPDIYAGVIKELDELYADGQPVSFHALRQIPRLENVLKETLRLHPPLIILMRVAKASSRWKAIPSTRVTWWRRRRPSPTGSRRTSRTLTSSCRNVTTSRVRKT
ncbi:cytochrome P450 family protein [Mycobacterium xenopi 3993]|nr:cytochrome P450 family protein [Mycobacterium xenopi 3993]